MSNPGRTHRGKSAPFPLDAYQPAQNPKNLLVQFLGEDGRSAEFDLSCLPLPEWREAVATSWAYRTGPFGSLRTRASANAAWNPVQRFMRFLATLKDSPIRPEDLTKEHIHAYLRERILAGNETAAKLELRLIALVFDCPPLSHRVSQAARAELRPFVRHRRTAVSGYSDGELARLLDAAQQEAHILQHRLKDQMNLNDPALPTAKYATQPSSHTNWLELKQQGALHFVVKSDLISLLVLAVHHTGLNVETIKELPAQHRIIEDRVVELEVIKRRRGSGRWYTTVTWEIGSAKNRLKTPGGIYLWLHKLMAPARAQSPDPTQLWAIWHGQKNQDGTFGTCINPFYNDLGGDLRPGNWPQKYNLLADTIENVVDSQPPVPLKLSFNRLKTSADVRRTRKLGGHLPSAAKSNSTRVLFSNYLSGDQSTIEWAHDLMGQTFSEIEKSAWAHHQQTLAAMGSSRLHVIENSTHGGTPSEPRYQTTWTECTDHTHHPISGRKCKASFLDCFHCGNCVITGEHLPRIMALLKALELRRDQLDQELWWNKYGPTWAAINFEVLPKFSPNEVEFALQNSTDSLLDLVEPRWEQP